MQSYLAAVALAALGGVEATRFRTPAGSKPAPHGSSLDALVASDAARARQALLGGLLLVRSGAPAEKQGAGATKQPVGIQLSDEELAVFSSGLSSNCSRQFANMLKGSGSGSALHTFQDMGSEGNASEVGCQKLDGGLCFTKAHLEESAIIKGRRMVSAVDVDGNSCVPKHCVSASDLHAWSAFIYSKVEAQLHTQGRTMLLTVNCTAADGAIATLGDGASEGTSKTSAAESAADAKATSGKANVTKANTTSKEGKVDIGATSEKANVTKANTTSKEGTVDISATSGKASVTKENSTFAAGTATQANTASQKANVTDSNTSRGNASATKSIS